MGNCIKIYNTDEGNGKVILENVTMENTLPFTLKGLKGRSKVLEVYDGDTITIAFSFYGSFFYKRCRITGVDCAEIKTRNEAEKKVGIEAKAFLSDLILNKIVWTEFSDKEDKYGRLLAYVYLNEGGERIDQIMIKNRFGYAYNGEKKKKFEEWY
jgi:micrococcal nuclease